MPYKDPKKRKEAFKKYYEKNKEKVLEKNRKWSADNPEKVRDISNKSYAKRTGRDLDIEQVPHDTVDDALSDMVSEPETKSQLLMKELTDDLKEGLD